MAGTIASEGAYLLALMVEEEGEVAPANNGMAFRRHKVLPRQKSDARLYLPEATHNRLRCNVNREGAWEIGSYACSRFCESRVCAMERKSI